MVQDSSESEIFHPKKKDTDRCRSRTNSRSWCSNQDKQPSHKYPTHLSCPDQYYQSKREGHRTRQRDRGDTDTERARELEMKPVIRDAIEQTEGKVCATTYRILLSVRFHENSWHWIFSLQSRRWSPPSLMDIRTFQPTTGCEHMRARCWTCRQQRASLVPMPCCPCTAMHPALDLASRIPRPTWECSRIPSAFTSMRSH